MIINKLTNSIKFAGISSFLALTLTACGGGSSNNSNVENDKPESSKPSQEDTTKDDNDTPKNDVSVKMTSFGFNTLISGKVDYIERFDINVKTGDFKTETIAVYGKDPSSIDNSTDYYFGNGFSSIISASDHNSRDNVVVNNELSFKRIWKNLNGKEINAETSNYIAVDISEKTGIQKDSGNGFNTILNNLPLTESVGFVFPEGSKCYVIGRSIEKPYISFDSKDLSNENSLDDWAKSEAGGVKNVTQINVGNNNDVTAVYKTTLDNFSLDDPLSRYRHNAAVNYQGKIYTANYFDKYTTVPNSNIDNQFVDCGFYNAIATNFIEQKIKVYYK